MTSNTKLLWKLFGVCLGVTMTAFVLMGMGGVGPCGPDTVAGGIAMAIGMLGLPVSGLLLIVALVSTAMGRQKQRTQLGAQADGPASGGPAV